MSIITLRHKQTFTPQDHDYKVESGRLLQYLDGALIQILTSGDQVLPELLINDSSPVDYKFISDGETKIKYRMAGYFSAHSASILVAREYDRRTRFLAALCSLDARGKAQLAIAYLVSLSDAHTNEVDTTIKVNRQHISSMIGVNRETVGLVIFDLVAEGHCRTYGSRMVIPKSSILHPGNPDSNQR